MSSILDAVAAHLAGLGLVVYDPTGAVEPGDWSLFVESLPDQPDRAVALFRYGGPPPDPLWPWDDVNVQVRVRGTADPRVSGDRAQAVYSALHGLSETTLPGGVWVQDATANQAGPVSIGTDPAGRHEHTVNFTFSIDNPTDHRPAL